ncbi:MAG: filamentous hemagglutinin N-terminal domain-containing protein [Desulfamplus sp.]
MSLKQTVLCLSLIFTLILSASPALLYAEISTDGSFGAAQNLTGPDYAIPETLGTVKGSNLFHSFDKFSIKTEESATFTGSDSIKNVISRVTGGEKSEIDGTLSSNIGKADFYFINPSGVVFGENAKVDVPAAFHVSTADELKFKDGASFKASKAEQSTLTQAAPESFGFLGTQSASIEINGSTLSFAPESKVSLTSSKDITIKGLEGKQSYLFSEGGEIELKAKADLLMENATVATTGNGGGKITVKVDNAKIKNNSNVSADNRGDKNSEGGVNVEVGKQLELINSQITSDTFSKGNAGYVKINANNMKIDGQGNLADVASNAHPDSEGNAGTIEIKVDGLLELLNKAEISSSTFSKGDAGDITITTGEIKINLMGNFGGIISASYNKNFVSKGGDITITVSGLLELLNGGSVLSDTFSKGDAGNVKINAGNIRINGYGSKNISAISSLTLNKNSEGKAGTIEITVSGLLELLNGAQITSSTNSKGDAGSIRIKAGEMKLNGLFDYVGIVLPAGVYSTALINSEGNAGTVEITVAELLEVLNGGQIISSTWSKGDAGNVKINAKNMKIDGQGSSYFTGVASNAEANSEGDADEVEITVAELLEVLNGGQISSSTFSKGDAGDVKINAGNMRIDDQESSNSTGVGSSAETGSEGNTETVEITITEFLEVLNGGQISSSTWSKGDAGDIIVNADKLIADASFIQSASAYTASGYVGNVSINANLVNLINGSEISIGAYQTLSQEKLSNLVNLPKESEPSINLTAKQLTIKGKSSITSESTKNVPASDININADSIYLHDGLITTSVLGTNGDGGNITINDEADPADILVMKTGFIQANSRAKGGTGGRITINADRMLKESDASLEIGGDEIQQFQAGSKRNIIQAAAPDGNPKNDDIKSPTVPIDIGGSIINADSKIAKPVEMAENYCRFIGTKKASHLTRGGRGGIPPMLSEPSSIFITDERLEEFLRYDNEKQKEKEKEKNN